MRASKGFVLNAKVFDSIKNTNPRIEFRRILKTFFEELTILNYGSLPGDFVQAVNALKLPAVGKASNEKEDELRSLLSSFKTNMSKREEPKETVVKLKVVPNPPKKKKAATKKVKKAPAATKGTVIKVIKVKQVKKTKKAKGKGEQASKRRIAGIKIAKPYEMWSLKSRRSPNRCVGKL